MRAWRSLQRWIVLQNRPQLPAFAAPPLISIPTAAAPSCMSQPCNRGADQSGCGAAAPCSSAACYASSSSSRQHAMRRRWRLGNHRQTPLSTATELAMPVSPSTRRLPSMSATAGSVPCGAARCTSSGPTATAGARTEHAEASQQAREPPWRCPSEPQRRWDQPSDKRRLLVYYSDHYQVVGTHTPRPNTWASDRHGTSAPSALALGHWTYM
jgi:hypothetical protein